MIRYCDMINQGLIHIKYLMHLSLNCILLLQSFSSLVVFILNEILLGNLVQINILHKPARSFLRYCKFDQERNLNDHDNSKEFKHLPLRPRANPDIQPKKETDKSHSDWMWSSQLQQIYYTTAKDWILLTNNTNKNNHIMTINVYSGCIKQY